MKQDKVQVYLARFTNEETDEICQIAVGSIYDTLSFSFLKYEVEWKDLDEEALKDGWVVEKKEKEITF